MSRMKDIFIDKQLLAESKQLYVEAKLEFDTKWILFLGERGLTEKEIVAIFKYREVRFK